LSLLCACSFCFPSSPKVLAVNPIAFSLILATTVDGAVLGFGVRWRKLGLALGSADNRCAGSRILLCWERCCGLQNLLVCHVKAWLAHPWAGG
jgi:hypothetical protein